MLPPPTKSLSLFLFINVIFLTSFISPLHPICHQNISFLYYPYFSYLFHHPSSLYNPASTLTNHGTTGWMPAVRSSSKLKHYLTVDFGRINRVVKLSFTEVAATLSVKSFKIQLSHNGMLFKDACTVSFTLITTSDTWLHFTCFSKFQVPRLQ